MSKLPQIIADKFLSELGQADDITDEQIEALRKLLEGGKKLKPADIENIFAPIEVSDL
jgi:hypothetical protein